MDSRLILNSDNQLRETIDQQPKLLRWLASLLSYLFHPVFIPVYLVYFFLFIEPFLFVGIIPQQKVLTLIQSFLMYTFFPLVSILLLKALKFIPSIKLKERRDRIIPFIICNIWYFWIWYVWRNLPQVSPEMVIFAMGVFLASSIGLLFNIYMKISMHGIALGTAVSFLCMVALQYGLGWGGYIAIALLITGLVGTARLLLSDHTAQEVYWGLAVGVMGICIAALVL